MNTFYIHDRSKRSEHALSLLKSLRSELEIMNMLFIHDRSKRSEYASSLLESIRSELEIKLLEFNKLGRMVRSK